MGDHNARTVIILGAGSSREFDLPIGNKLMDLISEALSESFEKNDLRLGSSLIEDIFSECEEQGLFNSDVLKEAAQKIVSGLPYAQSIDNFLHSNKKDEAILLAGKIAIASIIIQKERESTLYSGPAVETGECPRQKGVKDDDSWLHRYFKLLVSNKTFNEYIDGLKSTTFVSFNYDRCVQQFFWNAALSYFTTIDDAAERTLDSLNVVYAYGQVGEFEFDNTETSFGNNISPKSVINGARSLRTFTEGGTQDAKMRIQDSIIEADNVLILGFGFIPTNMDLLFSGEKFGKKVILSTAFGISLPDRDALRRKLKSTFFWVNPRDSIYHHNPIDDFIKVENITASDLFHEYSQYFYGAKSPNHGNTLRRD